MTTNLKKILFVTTALILAVPLLVTKFTLYPYVHGKTFFVLILMHLGLAAFLYYRAKSQASALRVSPIIWASLIFLAAISISSFGGINLERSFWGSWPRLLGIYHWLVIFLYAWVLGTVFDTKDWYKIFRFGLYISAAVSVIAVLQKFLPLMVWHGYRVGSTLDNPSFLAGYLLFFVFWGLILLMKEWRWSVAICTGLISVALILTRTRGTIIALLIGLLVAALLMLVNKTTRRRGLQFLILTVLGAGLVSILDYGVVERFMQALANDPTVQSRLIIWKIAWQGFITKPWLGYGFENFNAVFNLFYEPQLLKFSYGETFGDKTHNWPLEMMATTGLFGLLAYVALRGTSLVVIWQLIKKEIIKFTEGALLVGLLTAYLVSLLFLFDQLFTVILFIFTLFYLHTLWPRGAVAKTVRPMFILVGSLILIWSMWTGAIRPSLASIYNHRAVSIFADNPSEGNANFKKALSHAGGYKGDIVAERAGAAHQFFLSGAKHPAFNQELIDEIWQDLILMNQQYPHDIRFPVFIGYLGNAYGTEENNYLIVAEQILAQTLAKLNSGRQQVGNLLTENYMVRGMNEEAVAMAQKMIAAAPTVADPHYYLGNALLLSGQEKEAFAEFSLAETLGYPAVKSKPYLILINQAVDKKDWPKVVSLYEKAILLDKDNAQLFAQLGAVYSRMGNRLKAIEMVKEAVRLDPSLQAEAEAFIKQLK